MFMSIKNSKRPARKVYRGRFCRRCGVKYMATKFSKVCNDCKEKRYAILRKNKIVSVAS
jgi:hypothetical protein